MANIVPLLQNVVPVMKKNSCFILLFLFCVTFNLSAQMQHKKKGKSPNVSLNISKTTHDSLKTSYINLGLLTNVYQLKGFGINIISNVTKTNVTGVQISGLANMCGRNVSGFQVAGLTNINGYNTSGMSASGLINLLGNDGRGVLLSGGINVAGKSLSGMTLGGLLNIAGDSFKGFTFGGLANVAGNNTSGLSISGLLNVNGANMYGAQISSLLNVNGNDADGIQLSALGNVSVNLNGIQVGALTNIAAEEMKGIQLGTVNYASHVKGIQIGLANVCKGNVKGVQLGLVNYSKDTATVKLGLVNVNPRTRIQMMIYGGNTSKFNLAVRFLNRHTYTILGAGAPYLHMNDKFSGTVFYRAGLYWNPTKNFRLSGDLGYYHVENFKNKDVDTPKRMYSLQARINVEYQLTKKFGIFASGGYGLTRYYNLDKTYEKKPIIEVGFLLF